MLGEFVPEILNPNRELEKPESKQVETFQKKATDFVSRVADFAAPLKSAKKIKIYSQRDFPSYLPKLNSLYDELFSEGKGFRSQLVGMIGGELDLTEKEIQLLGQTIEFIHNASLLHDDLVDRSTLRRGKPAAWTKYSPEYAVLAGDYLLARVMVNLSDFGSLKLIRYTAEMISDLLEGEWIQDSLVGDNEVELQDLDRVHALKTASLFKWCLRAPFLVVEHRSMQNSASSELPEEFHRLLQECGAILGLLFQRSDDLLDFDIRNFEGKAVLGDLKGGYLNSFAVWTLAHLRKTDRPRFQRVLRSQTVAELINFVGRPKFSKALEEFDQMNQKQIELYHHYLKQLSGMTDLMNAELVTQLSRLPEILYWRQQKDGKRRG